MVKTTHLSLLRFRVRSPVRSTRTQSQREKSIVNALSRVVGFLQVLRLLLKGWDRYYEPTVIDSCCFGEHALVAKLNKKMRQ